MGPRRLILKATRAIGRAAKAAKAARAAKSAKAREQREAVDVGPVEDAVALESPNMERGLEVERTKAAIAAWEARPETRLYEQLKAKIAGMKSRQSEIESNKRRIADLTEQSAILKQALNVVDSEFVDLVARCPLTTEFPAEFDELCMLVETARLGSPYGVYDESYGRDWIQFHLWGIVRRYRAIYAPDSQYPAQIGEIIKSANRVIPHLDQMIGALDNLDSTNRQLVMHAIGQTSPILLQPDNYQTFVNGLRESRALISSCEDGLRLATDIRPENPRTPPVRYGHLEKYPWSDPCKSDSVLWRQDLKAGAGDGAEGLFRCEPAAGVDQRQG